MAAEKKKPVMDVSKPGKSPADATARPIITGHAIMKDPMVTEDAAPIEGVTEDVQPTENTDTAADKVAAPSTAHKVIKPLETSEDKAEESEPSSEDQPEAAEPKAEETPVTEDAVVDAVLDQVGDKKQETKENEEERKRQEQVDKLVEEKKYFVPIGQVSKRRNNKIILLIVGALLPVLVGLALAADAGAINLGFKMPFDFIKDKQATTTTSTTPTATPAASVALPAMKGIADADTAKWTKLTSGKKGFSLAIPDGWEMTNYMKEDRTIATADLIYTAGKPAKIIEDLNSVADIYRFDVTQLTLANAHNYLDGDEQKQDFVSGTLKGTRYYKKYPVVASPHGPYPGSERYLYEFKTKKSVTLISYVIVNYNQYTKDTVTKNDPNQLELIEKLVKTLQIKE